MEIRADPSGFERWFVSAPEFDAEFEIFGNCPVQALGTVLGRELYFRARHVNWSFDIANAEGGLPSDGYRDSDGFYREGDYADACWMPLREGIKIITHCLEEYSGAVVRREKCWPDPSPREA